MMLGSNPPHAQRAIKIPVGSPIAAVDSVDIDQFDYWLVAGRTGSPSYGQNANPSTRLRRSCRRIAVATRAAERPDESDDSTGRFNVSQQRSRLTVLFGRSANAGAALLLGDQAAAFGAGALSAFGAGALPFFGGAGAGALSSYVAFGGAGASSTAGAAAGFSA